MSRGELFNSITHLAGTVIAVIGTSVLITAAVLNGGGTRQIAAVSVYGAMMVVLYLSATLGVGRRRSAHASIVLRPAPLRPAP